MPQAVKAAGLALCAVFEACFRHDAVEVISQDPRGVGAVLVLRQEQVVVGVGSDLVGGGELGQQRGKPLRRDMQRDDGFVMALGGG